jgi:hypothetical protein
MNVAAVPSTNNYLGGRVSTTPNSSQNSGPIDNSIATQDAQCSSDVENSDAEEDEENGGDDKTGGNNRWARPRLSDLTALRQSLVVQSQRHFCSMLSTENPYPADIELDNLAVTAWTRAGNDAHKTLEPTASEVWLVSCYTLCLRLWC